MWIRNTLRRFHKKDQGGSMSSNWLGALRPRGRRARACAATGIVLGCTLASSGFAASVPWTPSITGRHAIEVLVDDGGLPLTVSQWPLPRDAVQRALDTLPAELPTALAAARALVQAELRAQVATRITLGVRQREDALSGFGDDATPGSSLLLRSSELDGPHLAMQVGGRLDAVSDAGSSHATARLDDSAIAVDALGWQAQAWAHRSWWGVGWESALPLGNNAPALDAVGFQRASVLPSESPWLSWIGPWNADFFLARTSGEAPGPGSNSLLSGARITARPFSHVEIGLTRMVQFGGEGRAETLGSFARAVSGVHQNVPSELAADEYKDSGNGLAGYDVRVRCPDALRCAGYGQFIGEDDRKHLPYRFMNLLGAELWSADGITRLYFEAAEIGCRVSLRGPSLRDCAYRNHIYPGGYTSGNRWLGASVGSDARLVTIGWIDAEWDSSVRIDAGRVGSRIGAFVVPSGENGSAGRLWSLSARRTWHVGAASLTPEFDWSRVTRATGMQVESRLGLEMSMPIDDLGRLSASQFAERLAGAGASPTTNRLLAATALVGGAALFDRAAGSYVDQHPREPALKLLRVAGSALPFAEFGLVGAAWLTRNGTRDGDVALASVEAGLTSAALAEAVKLAVDRSRPREDRGAADFGHEKRSDSSFPSIHSALAWSLLTPVAQRYDAPWLYGVAALTNVGRIAGRKHWLSDTVAGGVLGYVVGDWFGKRADAAGAATTVMLVPHGAVLSTTFR
jgi:membrane-associated phospholipid phosphatase